MDRLELYCVQCQDYVYLETFDEAIMVGGGVHCLGGRTHKAAPPPPPLPG